MSTAKITTLTFRIEPGLKKTATHGVLPVNIARSPT